MASPMMDPEYEMLLQGRIDAKKQRLESAESLSTGGGSGDVAASSTSNANHSGARSTRATGLPAATPTQSTSATSSNLTSGANGAAGTSASGAAAVQPSNAPNPAGALNLPVAPDFAFDDQQLKAVFEFSAAKIKTVATKLNIQGADSMNKESLKICLYRLCGKFTDLHIDSDNGTISYTTWTLQLFQHPTA